MRGTYFETFVAGGLVLLVIGVLAVAFLLWRREDGRRAAVAQSFRGIGEEFRLNLQHALKEIADLHRGRIGLAHDIPAITHPQLDGLLSATIVADKRALAVLHGVYSDLESAKRRLRFALERDHDLSVPLEDAEQSVIRGICALYLWQQHDGRAPEDAASTRSAHVRDWLKAKGFEQDMVPGMALRDEVVECLRRSGMALTPKPLTHSAYEYYALPPGEAARAVRRKRAADKRAPALSTWTDEDVSASAAEPTDAQAETSWDPDFLMPEDRVAEPDVIEADGENETQGDAALETDLTDDTPALDADDETSLESATAGDESEQVEDAPGTSDDEPVMAEVVEDPGEDTSEPAVDGPDLDSETDSVADADGDTKTDEEEEIFPDRDLALVGEPDEQPPSPRNRRSRLRRR